MKHRVNKCNDFAGCENPVAVFAPVSIAIDIYFL